MNVDFRARYGPRASRMMIVLGKKRVLAIFLACACIIGCMVLNGPAGAPLSREIRTSIAGTSCQEDFESYSPTPIPWTDGTHGTGNRWTIDTASNSTQVFIVTVANRSNEMDIKKVLDNQNQNPSITYHFLNVSGTPSLVFRVEVTFDFTIVNMNGWSWVGAISDGTGEGKINLIFDSASNDFRYYSTKWYDLIFNPQNTADPLVFTPGTEYAIKILILAEDQFQVYVTVKDSGKAYGSTKMYFQSSFLASGVGSIAFAPHRTGAGVGTEFLIDNIDINDYFLTPEAIFITVVLPILVIVAVIIAFLAICLWIQKKKRRDASLERPMKSSSRLRGVNSRARSENEQ